MQGILNAITRLPTSVGGSRTANGNAVAHPIHVPNATTGLCQRCNPRGIKLAFNGFGGGQWDDRGYAYPATAQGVESASSMARDLRIPTFWRGARPRR